MKKKLKKKITKKTRDEDVQGEDAGDTDSGEPSAGKGRPSSVSYEKFTKMWTDAASVSDVATALGIKTTSASAIANRLRRAGVELKRFPRRGSQEIDVKKLNRITTGKSKD